MRLLFICAALAGIWFGWKTYGRRFSGITNRNVGNVFGGGGGGPFWSDGKRF